MKPLGRKCYGSIPHLPASRLGPSERCVDAGMAKICTEKARDKHDRIYIEEKLDGTNVAVAKVNGEILALQRYGYLARSSPHEVHHLFADWVDSRHQMFRHLLGEGEWLSGEWLAQVIGTRYILPNRRTPQPFVPFDIFSADGKRYPRVIFWRRIAWHTYLSPPYCFMVDGDVQWQPCVVRELFLKSSGPWPPGVLLSYFPENGMHGSLDGVEGFVYRVERDDKVDFLAKWVRPDKKDGCYLPSETGREAVWNWRPQVAA